MTEAYGAIRRKKERSKVTPPFDFAQDRESFDFAQDREPVERPVERQMMPCWWIRVSLLPLPISHYLSNIIFFPVM
jgi:hypothetical protein